ncbi:MAG: gluconate 2-dehydrogenase subunit 3 family protein [Bacteroidales bacterium]
MIPISSDRRDFLKTSIFGISGVFMLPSCLKDYTPWQFFTEKEAVCITAICEQIIPTDEYGPGATYAGVVFYMDKQLAEIFTRDQEDYRAGIKAIQKSAQMVHGEKFEALDFDIQTNFLLNMEAGELPNEPWELIISQKSLFRKITEHSMQGFYGAPRHGGNKNYISYTLMDLDYPYIAGKKRDTQSIDQHDEK